MGITISGNVTYGKPLVESLASMPNIVFALSQAVIDKTYLTWLDVSKLLAAFPEHVKVLGDTVTFQGPVAIVSSMSSTQSLYTKCMLGMASGVLCYLTCLFAKAVAPKRGNPMRYFSFKASTATNAKITKAIRITCFAAAIAGFYFAGRYLPTQAGVYFHKQPPFYV